MSVLIGHARDIDELSIKENFEYKTINNYPNYIITSDGRVWSKRKKKFLHNNMRGYYLSVSLCNENGPKSYNIHRLVAETFIENPCRYTMVNHRDEDKTNNRVENLEWCTSEYNNNYGTRTERASLKQRNNKKNCKTVFQFTKDMKFVASYPSVKEAWRRTGISRSHISDTCNNRYPSAGGFLWKFESEVPV